MISKTLLHLLLILVILGCFCSCGPVDPKTEFASSVLSPIPRDVLDITAYSYKDTNHVTVLLFSANPNTLDKIKSAKNLFRVDDASSEMLFAAKAAVARFEAKQGQVKMGNPEYYVSGIGSTPYVFFLIVDSVTHKVFFVKSGF